ncbi:hypothetical protein [Flavobacterium terrae]|uniref:Uncharacterized protein n=1 Tax=Flavobacterium terrae TaxID=415425 RepID=A0A1M6GVY5_9FLAO|nr:hypothetical protein [Flavobacterium terrae]SHJ14113.1 hypothetical protein SAMN05444363_2760 [Flavobacterium terrae]
MKKIDLENDKKIESGFKIPDNYFDSFEDRLMQRIENEETSSSKVISIWRRKSVWISGMAAALIVSIGTWMYFEQQKNETIEFAQDYLAYGNEITTEDIAKHLTEEDLSNLETEINNFDSKTETYINEYLN